MRPQPIPIFRFGYILSATNRTITVSRRSIVTMPSDGQSRPKKPAPDKTDSKEAKKEIKILMLHGEHAFPKFSNCCILFYYFSHAHVCHYCFTCGHS